MITIQGLFIHINKLKKQLETQINYNCSLISDNNLKYNKLKKEYDELHEKYIELIYRRNNA